MKGKKKKTIKLTSSIRCIIFLFFLDKYDKKDFIRKRRERQNTKGSIYTSAKFRLVAGQSTCQKKQPENYVLHKKYKGPPHVPSEINNYGAPMTNGVKSLHVNDSVKVIIIIFEKW